jgi:4,5-DOPA dioxygenase extradiol
MKNPLPTLFVPHGSPMFALAPGLAGRRIAEAARQLPTPRAIVIFSPHWETANPTVSTATRLDTIHDFHGFDSRLYAIHYPVAGCPDAAKEVVATLQTAGFDVDTDTSRGLDHGAWVPLMHMFPDANVPVIPVSIQHHGGPAYAYRVGQALAPLRHQGFLIIGSGNMTHNLADWQMAMSTSGSTPAYVNAFADWVTDRLESGDVSGLLNYRTTEKSGVRAHPRDDHLLPFFTALGAAGASPRPEAIHRGIADAVLAMDAYRFD